jgi:hypothetical protein
MLWDIRFHYQTHCVIGAITAGIRDDRVEGSDFQRSRRVHDLMGNEGDFDDRRRGLATLVNDRDVVIVLIAAYDVERGIAGIDRSCALGNALAARNSDDQMVGIPQSNESRSDRLDERLGIDPAETL